MSSDDLTPVAPWLAALRASQQRLAALVTPLSGDEVEAPSYASEWSIAQVLSHLGSGAEIFTIVLEAGLDGSGTPPMEAFQAVWKVWDAKSPQEQASDSLRSDAEFVARLDALDPAQVDGWRIEMFGGEQRLTDLMRFRLGEHAVHTWDVEVALDPAATVAPDAVELLVDGLGQTVARSGKTSDQPLSAHVTTEAPTRHFRLHAGGEGVSLSPHDSDAPAAGDASLRLPAESLIRLVYGRLDPAHTPPIDTEGIDIEVLRTTFPGF